MDKFIAGNGTQNDLWIIEDKDFALAQALYHKMTQRTESTFKGYDNEYIINYDEINQLYLKLCQMTKQWKIMGPTCIVEVTFDDDTSQKFSSFDRFQIYDKSYHAAVMDVVIKFSFLLQANVTIDEKGNSPLQEYVTTIRLLNRNAISHKNDMPYIFSRRMLRPAVSLEIQYVDYIIARNIIACIDSWVETLDKTRKISKIFELFQNKSIYFDEFFMLVFPVATGIIIGINNTNEITSVNFVKNFIAIILSLLTTGIIGKWLGSLLGGYISNIGYGSYLQLTKGDEKLIKEEQNYRKKNTIKSIGLFILSIISNVIITIISNFIISKF